MAAIERGQQRVTLGRGALGAQRIRLVGRVAAVDVKPVLDGEILEVAQPGIDADQCAVRVFVAGDAGLAGKPGVLRRLDDQLGQAVAAAPVETVGLCIFVDQPLQRLLAVVEAGAGEGRRQVPDGDRRDAALGLCRLAGIADDEGIDDRQRAGDDFGEAVFAERHCLAGQPFQRAVRADMDERMAAEAFLQPQAEGQQLVAGRQLWIVIVGAAVFGTAAIRRQRHGDIAEPRGAEGEGILVG